MTPEERAKRIAEFDVEIQKCNADIARYEAANDPEKVAMATTQREALQRLRAEFLEQ
ncbi:MAG TPA: hypothetical protein VNO30_18315 [Kofleriaceae bacterium]|nr:hypothetical protein [Kofleriaceae bacterium]